MAERDAEHEGVYRVTAAPRPHSDEQQVRINRYLTSMAIRTVCVILAVTVDGPLRWLFIAGAVGLPYVAVVMANARGTRRDPEPAIMSPGPAEPTQASADLKLPPPPRSGIARMDDA